MNGSVVPKDNVMPATAGKRCIATGTADNDIIILITVDLIRTDIRIDKGGCNIIGSAVQVNGSVVSKENIIPGSAE